MHRFGWLLVISAAACSSGTGTGMASLTGVTPAIKSASASSFSGPDGAGTMVLGWTIDLTDAGPGADCTSSDTHVQASIGIFTNQPSGGAQQTATLSDNDQVVIVTTSPPPVTGTAAATMGAMGVTSISGIVTVDSFHLDAQSKVDHIDGTISAGGTADTGDAVSITGTFVAPICN